MKELSKKGKTIKNRNEKKILYAGKIKEEWGMNERIEGATLAFIAASAVMIGIKYFTPAGAVSIWSYSLISIAVSLVVGIPASLIWRKVKGDASVPAPFTTVYKN